MTDNEYINMLVTERYWSDIKNAFQENADDATHQIFYQGVCYQCRLIKDDFCIGVSKLER